MANIEDFLLDDINAEETREVKFPRIKSPFIIKSITEELNTQIRKSCTIKVKTRSGRKEPEFNAELYMERLVLNCVVQPDLQNAKFQEHYKASGDAIGALRRMLLPGEFSELQNQIQELNGFDIELEEEVEEVKK